MSGSSEHPSSEEATKFDLRRLEGNPRKMTEAGDWFDAQWMWYKLDADSHKWIKYEVNKVSALEESYLDGIIQIDSPSLRRRPAVFISQCEVRERKKRESADQASVSESPLLVTPDAVEPNSGPVMKSSQFSLPSSMMAPTSCYRVKVEYGTQDYHTIEKLLRDSVGQEELDINNLEKLKNDSLWNKYISKKKQMTDELDPGESVNERHLFMPCRYDDVERIMKDNVHVSRLDLPDLLGPGHYFTSNASLCLNWCTENSTQSRFLLVCQVLLGTYTQGSPGTQARPRRVNGKFYDSLVDKITEPTVFAVSDVDQCYPAYIIDFSSNINVSTDAARRTSATQPREESSLSPTVPGYPSYPVSNDQNRRPVVQAVVNNPMSYPAVAPQRIPQSAVPVSSGVQPLSSEPRGSVVSSHAPAGHVSECVKAPPPYSERPTGSERVHSEMPPSYSQYPQPESADLARPAAHPVPRQPAERPCTRRPDATKKECVVM